MQKIKFDCHGHNAPAYGCNKPGDNSGEYIRIDDINEIMTHIYNSGYKAGHHDTVEGGYTDIFSCDMDTYHEDLVAELVDDLLSA